MNNFMHLHNVEFRNDIFYIKNRKLTPKKSKLYSIFTKCKNVNLDQGDNVLYLGAGAGTTVSYNCDIVDKGTVYCVENSYLTFKMLLKKCRNIMNSIPIFADANLPLSYRHIVNNVNIIYQDIAQKNQIEIFKKNASIYLNNGNIGIILLKTSCVNSTMCITDISNQSIDDLSQYKIIETTQLSPYYDGHVCIIVQK